MSSQNQARCVRISSGKLLGIGIAKGSAESRCGHFSVDSLKIDRTLITGLTLALSGPNAEDIHYALDAGCAGRVQVGAARGVFDRESAVLGTDREAHALRP